jgi:argininosuccinate synthase
MTVSPEDAPDEPEYLEIGFESGIPVSVNGEPLDGVTLINRLNTIAGAHGVGRVDMVENRLVGIKSREIYECPAGTVLFSAIKHLEDMTLDRETLHFKEMISQKYSELIYYGLWFSPLREALDAFVKSTSEHVTGVVRVKLYKGQCIVVGRRSPVSLYRYDLATYDEEDMFDHKHAEGFVNLWGLPSKVVSMVRRERKDEKA